MTISTSLGSLQGTWRPTSVTRAAAILLPGVASSFSVDTPLLDDLSARLQQAGVSTLQLEPCPTDFYDGLVCLLSALASLRRQGVDRMALIGMGSGASLAIGAGSVCDAVTCVAAVAPFITAIDFVADVAPRRLLLLHGSADTIAPVAISRQLYARAADPKELVIYPGERHDFTLYREEALEKLTTWTRGLLRSPFKPHCAHSSHMTAMPALAERARKHDLATPGVR